MNGEDFTYWQFKKALDDETCKRILDLGANKFKDATVTNHVLNKDIRDSSIVLVSTWPILEKACCQGASVFNPKLFFKESMSEFESFFEEYKLM